MAVAALANSADQRILDATLAILAREGVAGVSMRAVAREAGVAVGLANYHFKNKVGLISSALVRIGDHDAQLVAPARADKDARRHLIRCLKRTLNPEFLTAEYLSLRLQLWSLAGVDQQYADINRAAQRRYLGGLCALIQAARPDLGQLEVNRRASDILIEQNGVWLTAILITDQLAVKRAIDRCIERALG